MGNIGIIGAVTNAFVRIPALNRRFWRKEPFDEESLFGNSANCCQFGGDPVNMATGNFVYEKEYLIVNGLFPMSFKMFYNAQDKRINQLGYGWVHNFEASIAIEDNQATVFLEDGRQEVFTKHGGIYLQSQGLDNALTEKGGNLIYATHAGMRYTFDTLGRLIKKEDGNSNFIALYYDKQSGKLERAANNSGSVFTFGYVGGRLKQVKDNGGRALAFEYQNDTLTCIVNEVNERHRFKYDAKHRITKIINPLDTGVLENEYDDNNRMIRQVFPDGGEIAYEYGDEENHLVLREQNGNKVTYVHDDKYRSIAAEYSDGAEKYCYNSQNLRTRYIDKNGNETRYSYDSRSNLASIANPLNETVNFKYNHLNKIECIEVCGEEKLKKTYDTKGNATEVSDAIGRTSKVSYNEEGQPVKVIQPDGNEIDVEYDSRGNITAVAEPGSVIKYEYDGFNQVIRTTDGNGNTTGYEYNSKGDITKVTNALGHERVYEYNEIGKVVKICDFDGSAIYREYNCLGKPSRLVDKDGNETILEYDLMWNVSKRIDANGGTTLFEYNKLNRLACVTDAMGSAVRFKYDPNGNKTGIVGARGEKTAVSYDPLNRIEEIIEANGAKTRVEYDKMGNIAKIVDALGNESKYVYDKAGQMICKAIPGRGPVNYSYSPLGQIASITDSAGRTTKYEYLPGGLLYKELYCDGRSVEYAYDSNKNVVSRTFQDGYKIEYCYDCLNRIVAMSSNRGANNKYVYDAVGNVAATTDSNGNTNKYVYSPAGNLIAHINPMGNRTEYDYDNLNNLTEVKQFGEFGRYGGFGEFGELRKAQLINRQNSEFRVTRYERNMLGQTKRIIDALGNAESYAYDEAGNVISKLDKDGHLTRYRYDQANQLEEIAYADGKAVKLSYNPLKHLTEIKDWLGITAIETDELGRATKVTDHKGETVEYCYGLGGEKRSIKYPDGKVVLYQYDEALRLKSIVDGDVQVQYSYDENSRLNEKLFSNGVRTKYSYNSTGLLAELSHSDSGGLLGKYTYTYDNMANTVGIEKYRRGLEMEGGKYQYVYDTLYRLTEVIKDNKQIRRYGYDEYGNRSFMASTGARTEYAYNQLDQLLRISEKNSGQSWDFSYDARGNLTKAIENGNVKNAYEFSPANRLAKAVGADGQTADYEYNGLGFRVGKRVGGRGGGSFSPVDHISYALDLTRQYHNLLQTTDASGTRSYVWGFNVEAEFANSGTRFYLQDELGSPLYFIGEDGAPVESYGYDEFGNRMFALQPTGERGVQPTGRRGEPPVESQEPIQPFTFTGYMADSVSNTYFAQAREYSPLAGRFISRDFVYSGPNHYLYCYSNPLRYVDRNGLWGDDVHEGSVESGYGTIAWARELHIPENYAKDIGRYNTGTDYGPLGPFPNGDQSYHFNRTPNGVDSRETHAADNLSAAIKIWNNAQSQYDDLMQQLRNSPAYLHISDMAKTRLEKERQRALQLLGEGLHAKQDIQAHGQINASEDGFIGHMWNSVLPWKLNPDSIDNVWDNESMTKLRKRKDGEGRTRLNTTRADTLAYLTEFINATSMCLTE